MTSGDLKVTKAQLDRFLNAKTKPECHVCGENHWNIIQGENGIEHKHFTGVSEKGILSFDCFIVACMNCGSIRTHAAKVVKKWLNLSSV